MKEQNNNNCKDFEILIDEYIDGEISADNKELLEKHLSGCTSCKKELEDTLDLIKSVSSLPKDAPAPNYLWNRIEQRIGNTGEKKTAKPKNIFSINRKPKNNNGSYNYNKSIWAKYAVVTLIAAMLLIAILPSLFRDQVHQSVGFTYPYWPVIQIKGLTTINSRIVNGSDSIKLGEWIQTADSGKAMLQIPGVGSVEIEPNTKVRIVKTDSNEQRIGLEYGTINANITAKPRTFIVDSRSAEAIDLGCAYTFSIDTGGNGLIYVKQGMVEMESKGKKSLVPAGKFCITKEGYGPGTPYRENTSPELKEALLMYDFGKGGSAAVSKILKHATKGDAVTLINLLPKVDRENRTRVYERITHFVTPPKEYIYKPDSIPNIDYKELHEWINDITKQINDEIKENMKELQKNIKENIQKSLVENLGNIINNENLQKEIQENIQKHMEALQDLPEKIEIPNDLMQKEMEKMQEKMQQFDTAKFNRDMEKMNEKLEKMNKYWDSDKFNKEFEKQQEREQEKEQRQQELEQQQQEREQEMQKRQQELEQRQQEREQEMQQRMDELKQKQDEYRQKQQELNQQNQNYNKNQDKGRENNQQDNEPDNGDNNE